MTNTKTPIRERYLHGYLFQGDYGRSAEAVRDYSGQWQAFYYVAGQQVCTGKASPSVPWSKACQLAAFFVRTGTIND